MVKCINIEHYCHSDALSITYEHTAQGYDYMADTTVIMAVATRRLEKLLHKGYYNSLLGGSFDRRGKK
ncbi:hypothetical protein ACFL4V_02640 [Candidatus Latescibacterota bacterium]